MESFHIISYTNIGGSRGYPSAVWPLLYFILHPEKTKTAR